MPPLGVDAFLIWPRGGNSGDLLIADACERFLRDRGVEVWRSDGRIEDAAATEDTDYLGDLFASFRGMVTFAGGGNVGIYPYNAWIRRVVIDHLRPNHACLVFPQSASAPEPALARPQVTVWCRDAVSEHLLQQNGIRTALVPDMALYMDDRIPKRAGGSGTFFVKRTPGRESETVDHGIVCPGPSSDLTLAAPLTEIIATLAPYETVVSDRLHGGLIALMMRKKTVLLPVGYHKIEAFYDTWLRHVDGVAYVRTQAEFDQRLRSLPTPSCDLAAMFCEKAIPAFDAFLLAG
jgi:exopolysaccharide biosynthesis predicted pyruvyltransferase EpsI